MFSGGPIQGLGSICFFFCFYLFILVFFYYYFCCVYVFLIFPCGPILDLFFFDLFFVVFLGFFLLTEGDMGELPLLILAGSSFFVKQIC